MTSGLAPGAASATKMEKLAGQEWMRAPATQRVIAALTAEGAEVRFVGGCVRDALVGRPVSDVDLATHLPPEEVTRLLEAAGLKAVPTGLGHGTVTAIADHTPFEITTLRVDVETFGRHAKVAFTDDWTADAARRDFTFNALSCAPDGTLHDPFGGVADLRAGRVRFVGGARARIEEDYLRLLRYFRFLAYFGKEPPEPAVLAIARELAPELGGLSAERIQAELFKLLRAPNPADTLDLMIAHEVLPHVVPAAAGTDVLRALMPIEPAAPDAVLRLAALIAPGAGPETATRLRLSNRDRFALVNLTDPALADAARELHTRWRAVRRLGAALYGNRLRLDWARRAAAGNQPDEAALRRALARADDLAKRTFPLRGRDVLALGVPSGPELGRLLDRAEDWWIEQGLKPTRGACLDYVRGLISTG